MNLLNNPKGFFADLFMQTKPYNTLGDTGSAWLNGDVNNTTSVYVNSIAAQNFTIGLGVAVGRVSTHEFTHWAFQFQHIPPQPATNRNEHSRTGICGIHFHGAGVPLAGQF